MVGSHLSATHADDAVDAAAGIVEEGHGDGVFAGGQPVAFGGRVDLEDVSSGTEDGLLPLKNTQYNRTYQHNLTGGLQNTTVYIRAGRSLCLTLCRRRGALSCL